MWQSGPECGSDTHCLTQIPAAPFTYSHRSWRQGLALSTPQLPHFKVMIMAPPLRLMMD